MQRFWMMLGLLISFWAVSVAWAQQAQAGAEIGMREQLGQMVPLDIPFVDEHGQTVSLKQWSGGKPIILSLVYFRCPKICSEGLKGLAEVIDQVEALAGKDYHVLTVSFNEEDKPELALEKRQNYLNSLKRPIPAEGWRFLTGEKANIRRLTDAVGFQFQKIVTNGVAEFQHPTTLVVLSPEGKIVRYLYGLWYLPFDLKMALIEAAEGKPRPTIAKVLEYCFRYDPQARKYIINIQRLTGTGILLCAVTLFLYLTLKKKAAKPKST